MFIKLINHFLPPVALIRRSKYFDPDFYLAQLPGDKAAAADPAAHYLNIGWKQHLDPSEKFSTDKYLNTFSDVAAAKMNPLLHYERAGRFDDHGATFFGGRRYCRRSLSRAVKRAVGQVIFAGKIARNRDARILVMLHAFYREALPEIFEYLKNLAPYKWDLIVTTPEGKLGSELKEAILAFRADAKVIPCANRGFDVAPFLEALNGVDLSAYDVVVKLQSKGTPRRRMYVCDQVMANRDWFLYMYEGTVGAFHLHTNIDSLRHSGKQLACAKNLLVRDPVNYVHFTGDHLKKLGLSLPEGYRFAAGTCYMEKAEALRPLQALHLTTADFDETEMRYFSRAHAFERYLSAGLPQDAYLLVNACPIRYAVRWLSGIRDRKLTGVRIIEDPNVNVSDFLATWVLLHGKFRSYGMQTIKVGEINVHRADRDYKLPECAPYHYLDGAVDEYIAYCQEFRRTDYTTLSESEYKETASRECCANYDRTIANLEKNGYDSKSSPIVVQKREGKLFIADGQHRACWIHHKYGAEHPIEVLVLEPVS